MSDVVTNEKSIAPGSPVPNPTPAQPSALVRLLHAAQLNRFSGVVILGLIILVFGMLEPDIFLTGTNARSILAAQAIVAILAIGLLLPLAAGVFDLSAAQNLGFSAVLCGMLLVKHELPIPVAILGTLLAGLVIGVFNATLVTVVGLDSFIATLGTTSLLLAGSQILGGGHFIGPFDESFLNLTAHTVFTLPITVVYLAVFALIIWYALEHSPLGRRLYATGANPDAAQLSGVPTTRLIFGAMVLSGIVASGAGVLLASTLGAVSETIGPEYLLPAFAAAFLGMTQIKPGRFNVGGTLVAILLLGTGVQGLQLVGGPVWVIALFNGIALLVAVGSVRVFAKVQERRAVRRAARAARHLAAA